MDLAQQILYRIADAAIMFFEYAGVAVIVIYGLIGAFKAIKRDSMTKLFLAKGMALGLEFKMGSEILRTVVVRELSEIVIVAGIVALRAALTLLIHWEIKHEEKRHNEKQPDSSPGVINP